MSYDTSVRRNLIKHSINNDIETEDIEAHRGKISYTYDNPLLKMEKPEGSTYTCPNCNLDQFSDCWELHKESCKGK